MHSTPLSRRAVMAGSAAMFAHALPVFRAKDAVAQSTLEQWSVFGRDALISPVSNCGELTTRAAQAKAIAARLRASGNNELNEHLAYLKSAIKSLGEQTSRLETLSNQADRNSVIAGVGVAIGVATSAVGLVTASPVVIGAALGISVISGPMMFAAQIVLAKKDEPDPNIYAFLMTHGVDRIAFVATTVEKGIIPLAGKVIGVMGLCYGVYEAFDNGAQSDAFQQKRRDLIRGMTILRDDLAALERNPEQYRAAKANSLDMVANMLSTRAAEGASTNCRFDLTPATGPVLKLP